MKVYDEVLTDQLQQIEAVNIYSIPSSLLKCCSEYFSKHANKVQLNYFDGTTLIEK